MLANERVKWVQPLRAPKVRNLRENLKRVVKEVVKRGEHVDENIK
jgi:polyhydroxyalkanoate synthesis regulator phasin